jgi:hypothetical protein
LRVRCGGLAGAQTSSHGYDTGSYQSLSLHR